MMQGLCPGLSFSGAENLEPNLSRGYPKPLMRNILVSDMTNFDKVFPVAANHGIGMEIQGFIRPSVITNPLPYLEKLKSSLDGFPGKKSLHAPFIGLSPGCAEPLIVEATKKRLAQGLFIAQELGCENIIIHYGMSNNMLVADEYAKRSADFWNEFAQICPKNIKIHLENVWEESPFAFIKFFENFSDERFGVNLDIGHVVACSKTSVTDWIKILGKRITYCHMHDNDGRYDLHYPLGKGVTDFASIFSVFEQYCPDAPFSFECDFDESLGWLLSQNLSHHIGK